jgi:CHASE2 domain-containing sensor protein
MVNRLRVWAGWKPFDLKHFLVACLIGGALKLGLYAVSHVAWLPLMPAPENLAFDAIMRLQAAQPVPDERSPARPFLALIDIDDRTYRDTSWGGGEPLQAPREQLLELIRRAFQMGADQVVLDVLVEGARLRGAAYDTEASSNRLFAEGLYALLQPGGAMGPEQRLVLVRSIRPPPRVPGVSDSEMRDVYPDELRRAPGVDRVIALSQGRIVLAAPYFRTTGDGMLREWVPRSVVCTALAVDSDEATQWTYRWVDSVPLKVLERWSEQHNVPLASLDRWAPAPGAKPKGALPPAPPEQPTGGTAASKRGAAPCMPHPQAVPADRDAWRARVPAITAQRADDRVVGEGQDKRLEDSELRRRILYRFQQPSTTLQALDVLQLPRDADGTLLSGGLPSIEGAIVVIGQTHSNAGDEHPTPLGLMAGANVMLNAIDSLARYPSFDKIGTAGKWLLTGVMVVVMSYIYTRLGTLTSSAVVLAMLLVLLVPFSYFMFAQGAWVDFAIPLMGVAVHAVVGLIEDRSHGPPQDHAAGHA